MIIGSFPQYLHMIDVLGTHERPRDCRRSKKSASFSDNDRQRFCSRAQLTKPCLPLITLSLVHEAGLTFICPFINSLLQTQTSLEWLSVFCLLFTVVAPVIRQCFAYKPANTRNRKLKKFAGCYLLPILTAEAPVQDPAVKCELQTSGGSPALPPDPFRMKRRFCRLLWYSLINFVKLTSLVSLDIKLRERTHNQSWPLDAWETWLIFM